MPDVDSAILSGAIAGDSAAVAFLLQIHEAPLSRHVARRMPRRLHAVASPEDVVQDVCFEACRLIGTFQPRGESAFLRWLQTIANNRILALLRQQRARRTQAASSEESLLGSLGELAAHRRSPSASAAAHEFVANLERSLERLNPDYQRVLRLRFLDGFSVEETALQMCRTHEAVYLLSTRALKSLKLQLASASRWR